MPLPDPLGLLILFSFAAALALLLGTAAVVRAMLYPPRKTYAVALARNLPTTPEEVTPRGGSEVALTLADGSETPGFLLTGDKSDGPTLVLVHGYGDSRYGAMTWAPLLLPHAREVLVYDLRGQGENTAPRAHVALGDTNDLLRILREWPAPTGVVLFGYSMGAGIAIAAAALSGSQSRILGVIADGPYRTWDEPILRHIRLRGWPPQPITFLAGLALRMMTRGLSFDRARDAAQLRCPLLVLHGSADPICPLASAKAIADAAPAPGSELVEIEGGGHLDLARADEPRYRDALSRFLGRIADGPADPREPDRPHAAQGRGHAR